MEPLAAARFERLLELVHIKLSQILKGLHMPMSRAQYEMRPFMVRHRSVIFMQEMNFAPPSVARRRTAPGAFRLRPATGACYDAPVLLIPCLSMVCGV